MLSLLNLEGFTYLDDSETLKPIYKDNNELTKLIIRCMVNERIKIQATRAILGLEDDLNEPFFKEVPPSKIWDFKHIPRAIHEALYEKHKRNISKNLCLGTVNYIVDIYPNKNTIFIAKRFKKW
jgi:hypothetical protein